MDRVSTLASIFFWLGWLVVGIVVLLMLGSGLISAQTFRSPQAATAVAGVLAPLLLLCLGPFLAWGLLKGLCEIYDRLGTLNSAVEATRRELQNPPAVLGIEAAATPSAPGSGPGVERLVGDAEPQAAFAATHRTYQDTELYSPDSWPGLGRFLGTVPSGTKVALEGVSGLWAKVLTEHGERGWLRELALYPAKR